MKSLKKYRVIGLAIAVVIGGKVNEYVSATVSDILMPLSALFCLKGNRKPGCSSWVL